MHVCLAVVSTFFLVPLPCTGNKYGPPCLDWDTVHASGFYSKGGESQYGEVVRLKTTFENIYII
jgi:hypothetical protein